MTSRMVFFKYERAVDNTGYLLLFTLLQVSVFNEEVPFVLSTPRRRPSLLFFYFFPSSSSSRTKTRSMVVPRHACGRARNQTKFGDADATISKLFVEWGEESRTFPSTLHIFTLVVLFCFVHHRRRRRSLFLNRIKSNRHHHHHRSLSPLHFTRIDRSID
uniref:Uncharacterized protein n=1 Tax=Caenorhabditis japonica TaxID=281687 RepID=A0A8R1ITD6_CAEJA